MAQINGKDFCLNISDEALVRIALRQLREANEKITVQAVAKISGLTTDAVAAILRQIVDGKSNA